MTARKTRSPAQAIAPCCPHMDFDAPPTGHEDFKIKSMTVTQGHPAGTANGHI